MKLCVLSPSILCRRRYGIHTCISLCIHWRSVCWVEVSTLYRENLKAQDQWSEGLVGEQLHWKTKQGVKGLLIQNNNNIRKQNKTKHPINVMKLSMLWVWRGTQLAQIQSHVCNHLPINTHTQPLLLPTQNPTGFADAQRKHSKPIEEA